MLASVPIKFFALGLKTATSFVADIGAKHIEVAVPKSTISLVEHLQCFRLICFHGCNRLFEHGLSLSRSALYECRSREQDSQGAERANHESRNMDFLPVRLCARSGV